jgi:hypothetical protein
MATKFPKKFQVLIDDAIRHLWDPKYPEPDLLLLTECLEDEAWDDLVMGILGGYIDRDRLIEFLDDATLLDYVDVDEKTGITVQDRINFARGRLEHLLNETMCSIHAIDVESKAMPPASLCIMMYYHGQGGSSYYDISVWHTEDEYLASLKPEIILEQGDITDVEILNLWKKPRAKKKSR